MSMHKLFTGKFATWILTAFILALFVQASNSYGASQLLIWPTDGAVIQSKSKGSLKSYEVRKGQISLAQELQPRAVRETGRQTGIAASQGDTDTVFIRLFADVTYEAKIDSVEHHADGTMIIHGTLKNHKLRTVLMTIGPDGFIITVQDMNRTRLYRATGDSRQGSGTVTEIDMKKLPPMIR